MRVKPVGLPNFKVGIEGFCGDRARVTKRAAADALLNFVRASVMYRTSIVRLPWEI